MSNCVLAGTAPTMQVGRAQGVAVPTLKPDTAVEMRAELRRV